MKPESHILFEKHMDEAGIGWKSECRFHPKRKWRFDYIVGPGYAGKGLLCESFAIEIEGAIWSRGRHTRGKGYQADMEKYNTATAMGYRVLRFSSEDVLTGRAKEFLAEHVK